LSAFTREFEMPADKKIAETARIRPGVIAQGADLVPGISLSILVAAAAFGVQLVQERFFGHPYLEALVIAIVLGTAIRTAWTPGPRWEAGIAFCAKQLLETAVTLLGASISFALIAASGAALLSAIVATVAVMLAASYSIARLLGLPVRLSILIACGNSICGNSAIAAIAPIIGAKGDEIASSISFTAILGVLVVLGLPLLIPLLGISPTQYGIVAGLTVYAVPQVLAATAPFGLVSSQVGTLVKLVRVLTLGPILLGFSLLGRRLRETADGAVAPTRVRALQVVPWFVVGFVVLAVLRSFEILPGEWAAPLLKVASLLTLISMAALGLGVDVRVIGQVGARVTAAVTLSLLLLLLISLAVALFFK
jgi:uncharacterized integral membrane protein (TIGR00698 family)